MQAAPNPAPPPAISPDSQSPDVQLYEAASQGDIERIKAALARGGKVDARVYSQSTPFMAVMQCRNRDAVAFLLRQHPDLTLRDNSGNTVLHLVMEPYGYAEEVAKKLGNAAYYQLCDTLKVRIVEMLIAHGTKVDDVDDFGYTPLQILVYRHGSMPLIGVLARHGANLNVTGKRGQAPLHIAVASLEWNYARALLAAHANPNVRDNEGRTPLMLATYGSIDEYKMLIDAGADVNARDKEGRTPLITLFESAYHSRSIAHSNNEGEFRPEGVSMPDEACLALLFRKGANVNARSRSGQTALAWAKQLLTECEDPTNDAKVERYIRILKSAGARDTH